MSVSVDVCFDVPGSQVITTDGRFEVELRQKPGDHLTVDLKDSYVRNQPITTDSRLVRVYYVRNQVIITDSKLEGQLRQKPVITTDGLFQVQLHQKPGGHDEHHHSRHAGRDSKGVAS